MDKYDFCESENENETESDSASCGTHYSINKVIDDANSKDFPDSSDDADFVELEFEYLTGEVKNSRMLATLCDYQIYSSNSTTRKIHDEKCDAWRTFCYQRRKMFKTKRLSATQTQIRRFENCEKIF